MRLRFVGHLAFLLLVALSSWAGAGVSVRTTSPQVNPDGACEPVGAISFVFDSPAFVGTTETVPAIVRLTPGHHKRIVKVGGQTDWQSFTPIPLAWEDDRGLPFVASSTPPGTVQIVGFYPGDPGTGAGSYLDIRFNVNMQTWPLNGINCCRVTLGVPSFTTNNSADTTQADTRIWVDFTPAPNEFLYLPFWQMGLECRQGTSFEAGAVYPATFVPAVLSLAQKN